MKRMVIILSIIAALLVLSCLATPAGAALLEVTVKGTAGTISQGKNLISVEHPSRYGCDYQLEGKAVCSWMPMTVTNLRGTVPDQAVFSLFNTGDPVVATSLGGEGGQWITIAKLSGTTPDKEVVTDIVGDTRTVSIPLAGSYELKYTTTADCTNCSGNVCTATSANVTVKSGDLMLQEKLLVPGEAFVFSARNDGSSVRVTFVKGESLSEQCGSTGLIGGRQPVSDFIIKIVPPISGTAPSTTVQHPSLPTGVSTKAGGIPVATIVALGVLGIFRKLNKN